MKKFFLMAALILCFTGIYKNASAQYYFFDDEYYDSPFLYEAGISVNAMNSLTDIGGTKGIGRKFIKDLNIGYTQASGGVFFNVAYKNAVALRLEGTFGKIAANDIVLKDVPVTDIASERYNRNLNFRSYITEVALLLEIHPKYIFIDWPSRDNPPPRTSPYLLAGVGYFSFNPQTKLGNRYVDLQPLRTEGQGFAEYGRKEYKLNQLNIPLGAGLKYELSPLVNLRGECIYRKTFTDYIDDLSTTYIDPALFGKYLNPQQEANAKLLYDRQILNHAGIDGKRGTEKNKDAYFSFNLKISVVIGRERMRR
jgi:Domain of unknown function (DUF6089)